MTSIAIFGAAGRMGTSMVRDLAQFPNLKLVAAVDRADIPAQGQDAGTVAGVAPLGVAISADAEAAVAAADVVIDFTFHATVPATAALVEKYKKAYVVGTTALTADEMAAVERVGAVAPVIQAYNMSTGINLLLDLVRKAASVLPAGYDIEIVEMHHRHKKDAPSGTAVSLAKAAAAGRGLSYDDDTVFGREGITGERPADQIAVHALRGGDVVGDHTVIFAADGERVEISHKATSRSCFSTGVLRAATWLAGKPAGMYTMAEVLGL